MFASLVFFSKSLFGFFCFCLLHNFHVVNVSFLKFQVLNTGGQLTLRAAPTPPQQGQQQQQQQQQQGQPQQQQPNNRIMAQQQQQQPQYEQYQQPQHPVYQQPHQHHSANELYEMYDEYGTGSHPNSNHYSDGGYDVYQQQTPQHHDLDMDRRLSLQQQISSNRWV